MNSHVGLLMEQKKLSSFDEVMNRVTELRDRNFDDATVDMKNIKVTPHLHLDVPKVGVLTMTEWAKKQLGSMIGVTWDKWFDPKLVDHRDVQSELQKRFCKSNEAKKIRARKFDKKSPGVPGADGYMRALLSPTYASIDDHMVFDRMRRKFKGQMENVKFVGDHIGTDFFTDRTSHYTVVTEPTNMGPIDRNHRDLQIRHIYDLAEREGQLPDADWVYYGYHMRNSEVGYTALTIDNFCFRLICLNGVIVSTKAGRLLYRTHRTIDSTEIDGLLSSAFQKMPGQWEQNRKDMLALQKRGVDDVKKEMTHFLKVHKVPKSFQEEAAKSWDAEPLRTAYGVVQAITRAAQQVKSAEKQFEYEQLAGRYIAYAITA